jgi:MOSC N-terminal beta barrel domain
MMIFSNDKTFQDDLPLVVVLMTTVAAIMITTQVKPIARPIQTFFARLYLQCLIFFSSSPSNKNGKKAEEDSAASPAAVVVSDLYVYPVKSLRVTSCESATVDERGLVGDRRYMLVTAAPTPLYGAFGPNDATHRFLTQRQCPSLARVNVNFGNATLSFSTDVLPTKEGDCSISATPDPDASRYNASLWGDTVHVQDMGDAAAEYFCKIVARDTHITDELKGSVRLVVQELDDPRITKDKHLPATARSWTGINPSVTLSDGYPMYVL